MIAIRRSQAVLELDPLLAFEQEYPEQAAD